MRLYALDLSLFLPFPLSIRGVDSSRTPSFLASLVHFLSLLLARMIEYTSLIQRMD